MSDIAMPPAAERPQYAVVESVLLIDGDNDPHLPDEFAITDRTLVRVFLREGATMPRTLERRLGSLPWCVSVSCTQGGANAADFVMSLHAGILHATLPMHLPFVIVTNDKALSAIASELQRAGRQASLWTSHPEKSAAARGRRTPATPASLAPARRRRRGGSGRARRAAPAKVPVETTPKAWESAEPIVFSEPVAAAPDPKLAQVAASYAARLNRIKDPPSRLKTLINDIANRTKSAGLPPESIIEELKRGHGLLVDAQGRVSRAPLNKPAA